MGTSGDQFRIGHGYDLHRVQAGGTLVLGGVVVSTKHSAIAHSDGDVVIHALVDAILGALGLGDIGEMFPNDDPTWKGADSGIFLEAAMERVKSSHMRVANVDVTVLAETPKLKPYKGEMREKLAKFLGTLNVNIKAGTNEGCDSIGRGEAIAAHAVVLLSPAD